VAAGGSQGAPGRRLGGTPRPVEPRRLSDLSREGRRRAITRTVLTLFVAWVVIFGAYFANPIGERSGIWAFSRLGADIAAVAAVLVWQVRRIEAADVPELRAVEALGIVTALFLCVFSGLYLGLSHSLPRDFSTRLDHVRALYFTISVFSTVGFGDIVPRSDTTRMLVSVQMLLDLALIGAVVRLIFNAARSRIEARESGAATGQLGDSAVASPRSPGT
jgi:voltage-gated potassium channel